jgi:c(7)-type cytochrome triheme protein
MIERKYPRNALILGLLISLGLWVAPQESKAEYADVVINNYADAAGMRPAVFPHWFHRIRFRCKVCHADLGFQFKAGGNQITMAKIIEGQFCGACHNGEIAWSVENCAMCHSGIPGTPTHFHGSTLQRLVAPAYKPLDPKETAGVKYENK